VPKDEETKEIKSTNDLNSLEQWVWLRPGFLPSGNLKAKEVEGDDEEEQAKNENREQNVERLLKLENDRPNWKIGVSGLNDTHKLEGKDVS